MRPLFDNLSFIDNKDAMRRPNRTQSMRNDKDRTSLTDLRHVSLDYRFGFVVQCAQGYPNHNYRWHDTTFPFPFNAFLLLLFHS